MWDYQNRREFLKGSTLAALGSAITLPNSGPTHSARAAGGATLPQSSHKGLPTGKLGNLQVTRLFLGCNQVSGYAHSRDLDYVNHLMREYQTDERVLTT